MKRAAAWTAAILGGLALAACDTPESRDAGGASSRAVDAPLSAPEPARFAKPGPPAADPAPAPAAAIARMADAIRPAAALPAGDEAAALDAGRLFDARLPPPIFASARPAVRPPAAAAPRVKPAAAATSGKRNSPIPDRSQDGALVFENRQFAVDTDGWIADPARRRQVVAHDRAHRDGTALYVGGRPLDATVVPYISIPMDFKGARLGDLAKVCRGSRCAWAVVGDLGPNGRFGEGSVALAEELGLDPDGDSGGAMSGVTYDLYPGLRAPTRLGQAKLASNLKAREADAPILLADAR